jgi:predicted nucleotidyltransferase
MKLKKPTKNTGGRGRPPKGSPRLSKAGKSRTATIHLPRDFADFLRLLNSHRVEYLLIGGYAVCYHGYYRNTNDIDLWIAINPANARRMVCVVKEFGLDVPEARAALFLNKGRTIRMGIEPNRIEIFSEISAREFADCYARRVQDEMDGIPVNLISLEDLKINKRASARNKDLADLDYLP